MARPCHRQKETRLEVIEQKYSALLPSPNLSHIYHAESSCIINLIHSNTLEIRGGFVEYTFLMQNLKASIKKMFRNKYIIIANGEQREICQSRSEYNIMPHTGFGLMGRQVTRYSL